MSATPEFLALQTALKGRYSLEHELGRGGMGIVFLAHEVALDRPVAIKLLPPDLASKEELRARFLREARTVARLSHPHIVPIYAVDEADDLVFFVMAYVDGETLGERIRQRGPLSHSEAVRVMREVAWALGYAHAQGVVHRDVKPDNVLLEAPGARALVTDFGIARDTAASATDAADLVGTAEFMSPEQARGAPVDARSDLYSLGVVGFYALSGRVPFEGPVPTVLARHIDEPPPPLPTVVPEVPSKLAACVDRCLRKDPAQRFSDGEELAEALGRSEEVKRELPVPLRVFMNRTRDVFTSAPGSIFVVLVTAPWMAAALIEGNVLLGVLLLALYGIMTVGPLGFVAYRVRKLLRDGYGLDELRLAFKQELRRREEELAFEFGSEPTRLDRILKGVTVAGLTVASGAALLIAAGAGAGVESLWLAVMGGITTGGLTGLVAASRERRRRDVVGERWLRFWGSRAGRWLFRASGVGLDVPALSAGATYRPTEMALGLATDRLFRALPKETRRSLAGLPDTVRDLETAAQTMRAEVTRLDEALTELEAAPGAGEERSEARRQLESTRDACRARLSEAVSALETIRLGLLRMQTGSISVESVTRDLSAAEDLSREMEHLVEGHREVERLLRGGGADGPED